ncbi:uncharacterized protein LOC144453450 [Glandiceps talaboti]
MAAPIPNTHIAGQPPTQPSTDAILAATTPLPATVPPAHLHLPFLDKSMLNSLANPVYGISAMWPCLLLLPVFCVSGCLPNVPYSSDNENYPQQAGISAAVCHVTSSGYIECLHYLQVISAYLTAIHACMDKSIKGPVRSTKIQVTRKFCIVPCTRRLVADKIYIAMNMEVLCSQRPLCIQHGGKFDQ